MLPLFGKDCEKLAHGGDRTLDLRIYFCTAYKYDALTNWATRAGHDNDLIVLETCCFAKNCDVKLDWKMQKALLVIIAGNGLDPLTFAL